MPSPIGAERWSAARAIFETTTVSGALLGRVLGCDRSTVHRRIMREGWTRRAGHDASGSARPTDGASGSVSGGFDLARLEALADGLLPGRGGTDGDGAFAGTVAPGGVGAAARQAEGEGGTGVRGGGATAGREDGSIDADTVENGDLAPNSAEAIDLDAIDRLKLAIGRAAERILADADAGGGRVDLEALAILTEALKVLERVEKLAFPLRARQQKRSDDELAGTLKRIDDRIIELAEAHAGRLVAERDRPRGD